MTRLLQKRGRWCVSGTYQARRNCRWNASSEAVGARRPSSSTRYEVYDRDGEKIGKVDDLFVDENDQVEYMGVKMGLLGLGGSALVPWDAARVNEGDRRIEVSADKETVKNGPGYDDDQEITPEYEEQVRSHYGLGGGRQEGAAQQQRGAYGDYYDDRDEDFTSSAAAAAWPAGNVAKRRLAARRPVVVRGPRARSRSPKSVDTNVSTTASAGVWARRGAPTTMTN